MAIAPDDFRIRMALAAQAYAAGTVRIASDDLSGFDHLVATRNGLFVARPGGARLIAYGQVYGITIDGDCIYVFEACDMPRIRRQMGRIIRFRHGGGRILAADVVQDRLDNGCHQIDLIDGRLIVADTYNQRLLRLPPDGGAVEMLHPLPPARDDDPASYGHVNSLLAVGDTRYLLLHNNSVATERDSEVAVFDAQWRRTGTIALAGRGCHNLALLEDGRLLVCGSLAGELIGSDGSAVRVTGMMTRGLSVDAAGIVVGGSQMAVRGERYRSGGAVFFLDRDYGLLSRVDLPGAVMEIRRIDGADRSLSAHLARA